MTSKRVAHVLFGIEIVVCIMIGWFIVHRIYVVSKKTVNYIPINTDVLGANDASALKHYYEFKPNIRFTEQYSGTDMHGTYSINGETLNATRDFDIAHPPETLRIATLGDSFTMGVYVDTKDTWPSKLEEILNTRFSACPKKLTAEVINLGMEGYDIEYEVERFRLRGQKYSPDVLLWYIRDNDFIDTNELLFDVSKQMQDEIGKVKNGTVRVYSEKINQIYRDAHKKVIEIMGYDGIVEYQRKLLYRMGDLYTGRIIIITDDSLQQRYRDILSEYVSANKNIRIYYLHPFSTFPDEHPNHEGHRQIASQVGQILTDAQVASCDVRVQE